MDAMGRADVPHRPRHHRPYRLLRSASGAARGARPVLLADVTNQTGQKVFDGALNHALIASLTQSTHVNVLSNPQIGEVRVSASRSAREMAMTSS